MFCYLYNLSRPTSESLHLHCKLVNLQNYFLGHDGFTRSASNASFTLCDIFTLKSSSPVYAVQLINTFYRFIDSNVAQLYDQIPFLLPIQYDDKTQYFYRDIIPTSFPKLRSDLTPQEVETLSHQASNWNFNNSLE